MAISATVSPPTLSAHGGVQQERFEFGAAGRDQGQGGEQADSARRSAPAAGAAPGGCGQGGAAGAERQHRAGERAATDQ